MGAAKIKTQIYISEALHGKISYIAGSSCRTLSKEIEFLIRNEIIEFEGKNGEITIENIQQARKEGVL